MIEAAPTPSFGELYQAWCSARRRKRPSHNQLVFESRWLENLIALRDTLQQGEWWPAPAVCFVTTRPKAREIHAPDFADRVVHHWLVPRLELLYEPVFIHDSYSNRKGKGTHAAVDRLQTFMRQVRDGSGAGKGWCLQLDIRNFFNRIHRPTLYELLKRRLLKGPRGLDRATPGSMAPQEVIGESAHWHRVGADDSDPTLEMMRLLCHRLLVRHPSEGVRYRGDAALHEVVPEHKRLVNAPKGCGLPIGNLTSQFFANVYLHELDQFVKHQLKCKHYVRYVDDFVLVHEDREQLVRWQADIERFLAQRLRLELKADVQMRPIDAGVDFLGYHLFAHGRRLRKRVLAHCRERLDAWQSRHVQGARRRTSGGRCRTASGAITPHEVCPETAHRQGVCVGDAATALHCPPGEVEALRAQLASYQGHFSHAGRAGVRAWAALAQQYPWMKLLFIAPEAGNFCLRTTPAGVTRYASQVRWFVRHYPQLDCLLVQRGNRYWLHPGASNKLEQCQMNHGHLAAWRFQAAACEPDSEVSTRQSETKRHDASWDSAVAHIHPGVVRACCRTLLADGLSLGVVSEHGWLRGGMRRRVLVHAQGIAIAAVQPSGGCRKSPKCRSDK